MSNDGNFVAHHKLSPICNLVGAWVEMLAIVISDIISI
jgi:hypothetical protein